MLVRTFYVSQIVEPLGEVDVQVLLGEAQIRNRRLDVTGMLAKSDGHFCQILEGRQDCVDEVMRRVLASRRHRGVRILVHEQIERRRFGRWAMGLVVRDDMAPEMDLLYRRGDVPGETLHAVIDRLMAGPPT